MLATLPPWHVANIIMLDWYVARLLCEALAPAENARIDNAVLASTQMPQREALFLSQQVGMGCNLQGFSNRMGVIHLALKFFFTGLEASPWFGLFYQPDGNLHQWLGLVLQ